MSPFSELMEDRRFRRAPSRADAPVRVRTILVLLTLIGLVAVLVGLLPATRTVRVYLLVVVAIAAFLAVQTVLGRLGRLERRPRRRQGAGAGQPAPPFLERAERHLELASVSAGEFEHLRPELRAIADRRLAARGLRFESAQARELLGPDPWQLLERPPEGDQYASGPEPAELRRIIEQLESL